MPRKPKFRPVITRVKLNPEQAVLSCSCWMGQANRTAVLPAYFTALITSTAVCWAGRSAGSYGTGGCGSGVEIAGNQVQTGVTASS